MSMSPGLTNSTEAKESTIQGDNRRNAERYQCSRPREVRLLARPDLHSHQAVIRDFTRLGLGLLVQRPFDAATVLAIQLRSANTGLSCVLAGTVNHCTDLKDGTWLIGCRLNRPLSDEEALALL
jgi:hypothetical protein